MTDTITAGAVTIEPTVIEGFRSSRESRNKLHPILGSAETDVTLRPASRRSGDLTLVFGSADAEADSAEAEAALATGEVYELVPDAVMSIAMSFVVTGSIERELDPQTRTVWLVRFGFMEVAS